MTRITLIDAGLPLRHGNGMTHRKIRGDDGNDWDIWDVIPSIAAQALAQERSHRSPEPPRRPAHYTLPPAFRDGWLAFQSENESRRLAPIPTAWNQLSDAELRHLISEAAVSPIRLSGRQREEKADQIQPTG